LELRTLGKALMTQPGRLIAIACAAVATACVTVNRSVLSESRMAFPVPQVRVQVYFPEDSVPEHERIAILNAEGDDDLTDEAQMIDRLREEAGKLGANAIILGEVRDPGTGARVAAAVFGISSDRKGSAIAIFVPSLERDDAEGGRAR